MNIELRIAKIERLISDVSVRRAQNVAPMKLETAPVSTGWDRLERQFRTALRSARHQRECGEIGFRV